VNIIRNCLYALLITAVAALSSECEWSWTAPEPPLPNTEYWFYSWDSTSNGIPPVAPTYLRGTIIAQDISGPTILVKCHLKANANDVDVFHSKHADKIAGFKHLKQWSVVKLKPGNTMDDYKKSQLFEKVQRNNSYTARDTIPYDPELSGSWGMFKIQAPQAWDRHTTNKTVIVAVVDTGIDYTHEDLRDSLWIGPYGEHGYTCTNGVVTPGGEESWFHGTHVAGIIGATGNNKIGVCGVNWGSAGLLLSISIFTRGVAANTVDAVNGLEKMVDLKRAGNNIRVANYSWGFSDAELNGDTLLAEACQLVEDAGILQVCAGPYNVDADTIVDVPSGLPIPGIIAVMASDEFDNKAIFSGWGATKMHLCAPGVKILSTKWPNSGYFTMEGTSMAAGFVSGVAAVLFDIYPNLTPAQCKAILLDSNSLDYISFTTNSTHGGRLNMFKAITNPKLSSPPPIPQPPPLILIAPQDLRVAQTGERLTLSWSDTALGEDRWLVERRTKAKGRWGPFGKIASLPVDSRSEVLGAIAGQYEFRVKACKEYNCSPYSNKAGIRVK